MPDYSKGKIYKIVNNVNDEIYIGSTIQKLSSRMSLHRADYKSWKAGKGDKCYSYELFDKYGIENCYIRWLEDYPCDSKMKLEAREQEWQDKIPCVNKKRASTGIEISKKENPNEYYKAYREKFKNEILEYREQNKEKFKEYQKEYREQNKDKMNEKFNCECGGKYTKHNKSNHVKTKKHLDYFENLKNVKTI